MRNLIETLIYNLEYFGLTDDANYFREEAEKELRVNEFPDNQALWCIIKHISETLENYTA